MPAKTIEPMKTTQLPAIIYGTAWKEDRTEGCVSAALAAGFQFHENQRRQVLALIWRLSLPNGLWIMKSRRIRDFII